MKKINPLSDILSDKAFDRIKKDAESCLLKKEFDALLKSYDVSQFKDLSVQLEDLINIYLESDVAGDNQDRKEKLFSTQIIKELINVVTKYKLEYNI